MVQTIVVILILGFTVGYLAFKLWKQLSKPKKSSACDGCNGCSLRDEVNSACSVSDK